VIDLKLLRDDLDSVRAAYARRGGVPQLDDVAELDRKRRRLLAEVEKARAEQNRVSRSIPLSALHERPAAIAEAKVLADRLKELERELRTCRTSRTSRFRQVCPKKKTSSRARSGKSRGSTSSRWTTRPWVETWGSSMPNAA
jgi:seryl-tRNA synthetase